MTDHTTLHILIVDDDQGDARQIRRVIKDAALDAICIEAIDIEQALQACTERGFDCAIVDYLLPGQDGLEGITALCKCFPYMPVIMSTGHGDEMVAAEAMKRGAADYIRKSDVSAVSIRRAIENAIEKVALRRRVAEQQEELEDFADVLAHDLRAPSSSIQTFASYIKDSIAEGDTAMIGQYCDWAIAAARRMDTLVETLRQYTKADTGEVTFKACSMDAALNDTLANLHVAIQDRGAVITRDALPMVNGDAPQISLLLQNLIGNGLKYCDEPVPRIHVSASRQDSNVWLMSVKDNGIGIPEEFYKTVFEPFKRLHGSSKYEGTGLGLSTCRKIVARHGGAIWCESKEREGTTFLFTLQGVQPELVPAAVSTPTVEAETSLRS